MSSRNAVLAQALQLPPEERADVAKRLIASLDETADEDLAGGSLSMHKDPIVEEVRRARNQHAAKLRYNLDAICRDLKEGEQRGQRKLVSLPPRRSIRSAKSA